jgi:hypothetical protein
VYDRPSMLVGIAVLARLSSALSNVIDQRIQGPGDVKTPR